jgi:inward rectifier potassium channel
MLAAKVWSFEMESRRATHAGKGVPMSAGTDHVAPALRPLPQRITASDERFVPIGSRPHSQSDLYQMLLDSSWPFLLGFLISIYLVGNALFALGYWLDEGALENAQPGSYLDAFFFSVQTMATIGYGKIAPHTFAANVLVTIESFIGLFGLALVTGLVFAKFSRPTARVLFSRVAVVTPRDGVPSLMFRVANERGNQVAEAQVHVVLARNEVTTEGEHVRGFHDLAVIRDRNAIFRWSWTVIHRVEQSSPLFGATPESLARDQVEIIVSLIGFDPTFSQTIHARHAYLAQEILIGARFVDILGWQADGRRTIDYSRFHDTIVD